jgi:hypothetical protein
VSDPGPLPEIGTVCAHCSARFVTPVPIVGEPPEARFVKFLAQLADHLNRKHKKIAADCVSQQLAFSMDFSAIVVLAHFSSTDEDLAHFRDEARRRLHSFSRKVHVSDATIEEKVSLLGLDPLKTSEVSALLKQMRDVLEETFSTSEQPAKLAPSLILTA